MTPSLSVEWSIDLFPHSEIPGIIEEVLLAARNLKKTDDLEPEDHLTSRLFWRLIHSKKYRSGPLTYLHIAYQYPVFTGDVQPDRPSGIIDFAYIWGSRYDTYFAIEAKRLNVRFESGWRSLVGEYVTGDQGMMCFIRGKYSLGQHAAAMLGYVFDDRIVAAREDIARLIRKNREVLLLDAPYELRTSRIAPEENNVGETIHRLVDRTFVIYHLLVSV